MDILQPYIKEVLSGNGKHGWREIAAVKRYLKDLEDDRFYFDEVIVEKRLKAAKLFRHTKDRFYGVPFTLQPFQIFCIANIFGWYYKNSKRRRFRKFYFDIARKNGKTEFADMIAILHWFFDYVPGSELYFAATKREQALIAFDTAKIMLKQLRLDSQFIASRVRIMSNSVTIPHLNSFMKAVSSDSKTLDGLNPSCSVVDELHAHPNGNVLKVIETGMGARENPLICMTTTAGFNRNSFCKKYRDVCDSILRGDKEDETLFPMIFSMDEEDDWEDSNNWFKCNPMIGVSVDKKWLEDQYKAAKNEGAESVVEFKTKNLNIWTSSSISFIPDDIFMQNSADPTPTDEMRAWGAVDLSSTKDLTVYLLLFEDGSILPYFFAPEKKIYDREKTDKVDYLQWYHDGYIEMIPGDAIDKRIIKEKIKEICNQYNVVANVFDPWRAEQMAMELQEEGYSMIKMPNNYSQMTEPIDQVEFNFISGNYKHGGHPILRWNNENVMLKRGSNGGHMFDRAETKTEGAKIDGMVALAMAEGARKHQIEDNTYKGSGPIFLNI